MPGIEKVGPSGSSTNSANYDLKAWMPIFIRKRNDGLATLAGGGCRSTVENARSVEPPIPAFRRAIPLWTILQADRNISAPFLFIFIRFSFQFFFQFGIITV